MIDIEFIIAGDNNPQAEPGSLWLLECNPRFSGDIHTTLSNPGFLDLYFQVMNGTIPDTMGCGNYSVGVDMKSTFGNYYPTQVRVYYTNKKKLKIFFVLVPVFVLSCLVYIVLFRHGDDLGICIYIYIHTYMHTHSLTLSFFTSLLLFNTVLCIKSIERIKYPSLAYT
jgi:hypothetical protein